MGGDVEKYREAYSTLYSVATGPEYYKEHFDQSDLDLIVSDPYEFLVRVVVQFPPIKAVLEKWLYNYQHQRIMQAIVELAV